MEWREIRILTESEAVEAVANILMEAGANGVAIEDALDMVNFKNDQFGEILDKENFSHIKVGAEVMAYFPETVFLPEILPVIQDRIAQLPKFGLNIGKNQLTIVNISEQDWAVAWKKYYHPVRLTRYLTIVPDWEEYEEQQKGELLIRLDPGMAFGTGTHPTTRLTLQALESTLRGGESVLDVGTGSGVLSIAAKALGAKQVFAYDLDDVAVKSAKKNIQLNDYAKDVEVSRNNLLVGIDQKADIIVANILAEIILKMLEDAWHLLKNHGSLLLSGIIQEKKGEVLEKALAQGFILLETLQQGDWICFILKKELDE